MQAIWCNRESFLGKACILHATMICTGLCSTRLLLHQWVKRSITISNLLHFKGKRRLWCTYWVEKSARKVQCVPDLISWVQIVSPVRWIQIYVRCALLLFDQLVLCLSMNSELWNTRQSAQPHGKSACGECPTVYGLYKLIWIFSTTFAMPPFRSGRESHRNLESFRCVWAEIL